MAEGRLAHTPLAHGVLFLHPRQRFDRGIAAAGSEGLPLRQAAVVVELQQLHCGLAVRVLWFNARGKQLEAGGPMIQSGMKEPDQFRWLPDPRAKVRAFGVVATGTGQSQVVRIAWPLVFAADDVFHLTP